jgi:hypothetical protein
VLKRRTALLMGTIIAGFGFLGWKWHTNGGMPLRAPKANLGSQTTSLSQRWNSSHLENPAQAEAKVPTAPTEATRRTFSHDVPFGEKPIGQVTYEILQADPALMATQKLHRAVVKLPDVKTQARVYLQDTAVLNAWLLSLKRKPLPSSDKNLLERAFSIDGFIEAAAWKENPARADVVQAVRELLFILPPSGADLLGRDLKPLWRVRQRCKLGPISLPLGARVSASA